MKNLNIAEIEEAIEKRIAEESEAYDLDTYDINQIRKETYKANGWNNDPYPEEEEDEEAESEEPWRYRSMEDRLNEVGMTSRDFL